MPIPSPTTAKLNDPVVTTLLVRPTLTAVSSYDAPAVTLPTRCNTETAPRLLPNAPRLDRLRTALSDIHWVDSLLLLSLILASAVVEHVPIPVPTNVMLAVPVQARFTRTNVLIAGLENETLVLTVPLTHPTVTAI